MLGLYLFLTSRLFERHALVFYREGGASNCLLYRIALLLFGFVLNMVFDALKDGLELHARLLNWEIDST